MFQVKQKSVDVRVIFHDTSVTSGAVVCEGMELIDRSRVAFRESTWLFLSRGPSTCKNIRVTPLYEIVCLSRE